MRTGHRLKPRQRMDRTVPGDYEPKSRLYRLDDKGPCPTLRRALDTTAAPIPRLAQYTRASRELSPYARRRDSTRSRIGSASTRRSGTDFGRSGMPCPLTSVRRLPPRSCALSEPDPCGRRMESRLATPSFWRRAWSMQLVISAQIEPLSRVIDSALARRTSSAARPDPIDRHSVSSAQAAGVGGWAGPMPTESGSVIQRRISSSRHCGWPEPSPGATHGATGDTDPHRSQPIVKPRKPLETVPHVAQPIDGIGLITRRSQVRILPPLFHESPANAGFSVSVQSGRGT